MRRKRTVQAVGLLGALALTAAACGSDDGDGEGSDQTVGIALTSAGTGDFSFNDSAAAGAVRIEDELGLETNVTTPTAGQEQSNLELLVGTGANPVIAISFSYESAVGTVAPQNPDTQFGIVDAVVDQPNVTSLVFAEEQGSFLVGALAAARSESGNVGFIGAQKIPLLEKFAAGYRAGAKAQNPDTQVQIQWIGSGPETFSAPDKAQTIADSMADKGADVLYHAAGGSGNGMFNTCAARTIWCIGVDSDQYLALENQPDVQKQIITSMIKRVDNAVFDYTDGVVNGTITGGELIENDLTTDGVGYSDSNPELTQEDKDLMDGWEEQIVNGEVDVPTTL